MLRKKIKPGPSRALRSPPVGMDPRLVPLGVRTSPRLPLLQQSHPVLPVPVSMPFMQEAPQAGPYSVLVQPQPTASFPNRSIYSDVSTYSEFSLITTMLRGKDRSLCPQPSSLMQSRRANASTQGVQPHAPVLPSPSLVLTRAVGQDRQSLREATPSLELWTYRTQLLSPTSSGNLPPSL